jgi:hypothetical protein
MAPLWGVAVWQRKRTERARLLREKNATRRTDRPSLAAQNALAQDDKLLLPYARVAPATRGEAVAQSKTGVHPPSNCPWTRPATHLERGVDTASPT